MLAHFTEEEVKALGGSNLSKVSELANGKLRSGGSKAHSPRTEGDTALSTGATPRAGGGGVGMGVSGLFL